MNELIFRSLDEHKRALAAREYSSEELTRAYLERIEEKEPSINSFVSLCQDRAIDAAKESDERRRNGAPLSALDGIPYAAKDNIAVSGLPLRCGSRILEGYVSPFDATVISRLKSSGCILLGKTNLDEFAMGTDTETSASGRTKNPLDENRVTGGSSGGSAAAVAAYEAPFTLGSDTGGSVRQPAAFCGIVGLRPTYSALSRYGLVGFSPSLDTIGILSRSASECADIMNATVGADSRDATSRPFPASDLSALIGKDIRGMRIGVVREAIGEGLSEGVLEAMQVATDTLRSLGAKMTEISLPHLHAAYAVYYTFSAAEAASNLSRFDGVRYGYRAESCGSIEELYERSRAEGFGDEVKRRVLFGNFALSGENREKIYGRAVAMRKQIIAELSSVLSRCDLLLLPTASTHAYRAGVKKSALYCKDDLLCTLAALAGLPALSLPYHRDGKLPVGIQLMGPAFSEDRLFSVAHLLESALDRRSVRNE